MLRLIAPHVIAAALMLHLLISPVAAQTVHGHVVNSATGAGIGGVRVNLFHAGEVAYYGTTDSQGRFRIEPVKDGAYTVDFRAPGFTSPYRMGGTGQQPFQVTAGGESPHLEVKMQPLPKVSGRVLDAAGKPVPNASLWVIGFSRACSAPWCFPVLQETKTGNRGEYSITDVNYPGAWLLSATAPASLDPPAARDGRRLGWAQTFYPGATELQLGAKLAVEPGGELWNIDIQLVAVPQHRIRGRVLDSQGDAVSKASVTLGSGFGPNLQQVTTGDGAFEFPSVPEGEWRISASGDQQGVKLWASRSLPVKARDLDNVELRLDAPFALRGKIVIDAPEGISTPDLPNVILTYAGAGRSQDAPRVPIGEPDHDGNLTFANVYPGPYQAIILEPLEGPYYLDSIRAGNLDAIAAEVSILSPAQFLTVTYKYGGGSVHGTIEACGAARVMLIPRDPVLRRVEFLRETRCAANGQFEFAAVRPGEYYGFAIGSESYSRWYATVWDEGLLDRQAAKVTVRANEHSSAAIAVVKW